MVVVVGVGGGGGGEGVGMGAEGVLVCSYIGTLICKRAVSLLQMAWVYTVSGLRARL